MISQTSLLVHTVVNIKFYCTEGMILSINYLFGSFVSEKVVHQINHNVITFYLLFFPITSYPDQLIARYK